MKNLFTPLKNEYAKTACTAAVNKEQGILPKIVFCAMIILEKLMFIKTGHYRQKYSTNHTPRKSDILTSQYPQIFPTKTNQKLLQNILIFSIWTLLFSQKEVIYSKIIKINVLFSHLWETFSSGHKARHFLPFKTTWDGQRIKS